MEANFPVHHNYYEEHSLDEQALKDRFGVRKTKIVTPLFDSVTEILRDEKRFSGVRIIGFKPFITDKDPDLILRLYKKQIKDTAQYFVQTGRYAGVIYHKGCKFNITSGYGNAFLHRMLSFANDVYLDTTYQPAAKTARPDEFEQILRFLFQQSLEKAAILGLPQHYVTESSSSDKVRGRIDIGMHIRKEVPFAGKITSMYRTKQYVQPIIDVLYTALLKLRKQNRVMWGSMMHLQHILKQNYSGRPLMQSTIREARQHSVLQNPMFAGFKKALFYADIIINDHTVDRGNSEAETTGYLFDISQLFEVYLEKLLRHNIPDWQVNPQFEINMYSGKFYGRKMFPDIVMEHKQTKAVAVFDAKYKKMRGIKDDLDRADFYQIHTYIHYFDRLVKTGGLLYPLASDADADRRIAEHLFGLPDHKPVKFVVDGVKVEQGDSTTLVIESEKRFLKRMQQYLT